ncbi:hypothetical protein COB52_00550 [Candidatus Kaiserbacteria bacterium]|nr:MAG: hypothetical protein COB52_00550 [Candidatus Kaiserbacteria bacterium]
MQVIIGDNKGQGVRIGCRCFWDSDTDDSTWVSYNNENIYLVPIHILCGRLIPF